MVTVVFKQAPGQAVAPGEKPHVRSANGVIHSVPAAVAALEDGLGAKTVEMLGGVTQHRPPDVDASAPWPLGIDLRKGPVSENPEIMDDEFDRRIELRLDHRPHGVHEVPALLGPAGGLVPSLRAGCCCHHGEKQGTANQPPEHGGYSLPTA